LVLPIEVKKFLFFSIYPLTKYPKGDIIMSERTKEVNKMKHTSEYNIIYSHHAGTVAAQHNAKTYDEIRAFAEECKVDNDADKWYLINRVDITKLLGITVKSVVTTIESWHEE
jgi:CRISPR/Cas system CSM-associated protein Csm4 (group 5 of RAMP superfamily)